MAHLGGGDAVVSLRGGELALPFGWRGGCEIVVAGRDHAARALREGAQRIDELVVALLVR